MKIEEVKLGQKAKCLISGLEGVIDHKVYMMAGGDKVGIQPLGDGSKLLDGYAVDVNTITITDTKPIIKTKESKPKYELGAKVKHTITPMTGTVTGYAAYLNGCIRYRVTSEEYNKEKHEVLSVFVDEAMLELIQQPKPEKTPRTKTGGPAMPAWK